MELIRYTNNVINFKNILTELNPLAVVPAQKLMNSKQNPESIKKSLEKNNFSAPILLQDIGTEYNLCHFFMKLTGDQLVTKQLQMMIESQNLLHSLSDKIPFMRSSSHCLSSQSVVDFDCSVHDVLDKTLQTSNRYIEPSVLNFNEDTVSIQSKTRRIISRKNNKPNKTMMVHKTCASEKTLEEAMDEIKQNCARATFNKINELQQNYHKLQKRYSELQSKQKTAGLMKKSQNNINSSDIIQQSIMLTARNNKLHKQNIELKEKVRDLQAKLKNKSSSELLNNSYSSLTNFLSKRSSMNSGGGSGSSIQSNDNSYSRMWIDETKAYLKQRQDIALEKQKQIQSVYDKIQLQLNTKFGQNLKEAGENCCEKCCTMLKKIKQSLIKYRQCLQQNIVGNQELYKKYYEKFVNCNVGKNNNTNNKNSSINVCSQEDYTQYNNKDKKQSRKQMRV